MAVLDKGRTVNRCELCGEPLRTVLSLGSSPPTCHMARVNGSRPPETHYPLDLMFCDRCSHGQLGMIVDPDIVFPADYPYQSGNSRALRNNFAELADRASRYLTSNENLVVDIGANDGTLLWNFACRTVAVEPTDQALNCPAPVYREPFTEDLARRIRSKHGPAQVVTACNVLAHVPDVHEVMRGVRVLLGEGGVFITENHDLASVVNGRQWDTVYHEHARFWSVRSLATMASDYRLGPVAYEEIPTHGGSFRMTFQVGWGRGETDSPELDFDGLAYDAHVARRELRQYIGAWGIGATARATTVINYCGMDVQEIPCVVEVAGSEKIGRYIPGTRIPVVDEARLFEDRPPQVILFSWHMADAIVPRLRKDGYTGRIIVPLPEVHEA